MSRCIARFFHRYVDSILKRYDEASELTRTKVKALTLVFPGFITAGLLFILLNLLLVSISSDIFFVAVGTILLVFAWRFLYVGRYRASILILLVVLQVILSMTVIISIDHEPLRIYNLAAYCIISLLVSGLVGDRALYMIIVLIFSMILMTLYLVFFIIPAGLKPMALIIDASIGATILTGIAAILSMRVQTQVTNLVERLSDMNRGLDSLVDERTRQLEESQKQLIETEKLAAVSTLTSGLAHEINTPLGICITAQSHLNQALMQHRESAAAGDSLTDVLTLATEMAGLLDSNLQRMKVLVGQFRQIAATDVDVAPVEIDVTAELDLIVLTFNSASDTAPGIRLTSVAQRPQLFRISPHFCRQVLAQLVENALIHAFPGTSGSITIDCRVEGPWLQLSVADDGTGMDQQVQDRLFEPFFTTNRGTGHKGLGMMLVYNFATRLGGSVNVESQLDKGTYVTIRIPDRTASSSAELE